MSSGALVATILVAMCGMASIGWIGICDLWDFYSKRIAKKIAKEEFGLDIQWYSYGIIAKAQLTDLKNMKFISYDDLQPLRFKKLKYEVRKYCLEITLNKF